MCYNHLLLEALISLAKILSSLENVNWCDEAWREAG
jgi:hypothetical protein